MTDTPSAPSTLLQCTLLPHPILQDLHSLSVSRSTRPTPEVLKRIIMGFKEELDDVGLYVKYRVFTADQTKRFCALSGQVGLMRRAYDPSVPSHADSSGYLVAPAFNEVKVQDEMTMTLSDTGDGVGVGEGEGATRTKSTTILSLKARYHNWAGITLLNGRRQFYAEDKVGESEFRQSTRAIIDAFKQSSAEQSETVSDNEQLAESMDQMAPALVLALIDELPASELEEVAVAVTVAGPPQEQE